MLRRNRAFRPFASGRGRTVAAVLITFAAISALSVTLTLLVTSRSHGRAQVVEVAARQRTLAERYVEDVLLVRAGHAADPAAIGGALSASARVLLAGGTTPAINGDDDSTHLPATNDPGLRQQLEQQQRLVGDLTSTGAALLAGRPVAMVPLRATEKLTVRDPIERLRVLAALTSNVALNAARDIAQDDDRNINKLVTMQIGLGAGGLLVSLLLAWALIAATRRQSEHFRSLVNSSTDLVAVLGAGGCRYASRSFTALVGRPDGELLRDGFEQVVHEDDRAAVESARATGEPHEIVFRVLGARGDWRDLEAHVTDLRRDRHVAGVVLNARDITDRVNLEQELAQQAQRDSFANKLVEALEMADEESSAYRVVERAMEEVSTALPMELLLSDSSRAHLERVASNPTATAPGCPVQSPFSCVAVRRGSPVVFDSSEELNACPKLRDRVGGACSAACVPVGFMGRALGVLHVTGPDGQPPEADTVAQLTALAAQAGTRIGTVRAFEKTQLQASTDSLTGLANRRTLQTQLHGLIKGDRDFAFALADLDHFSCSTTPTATTPATAHCDCSRRPPRASCATATSSVAGAARSSP
jgi:PAS domain S-box-containing protein